MQRVGARQIAVHEKFGKPIGRQRLTHGTRSDQVAYPRGEYELTPDVRIVEGLGAKAIANQVQLTAGRGPPCDRENTVNVGERLEPSLVELLEQSCRHARVRRPGLSSADVFNRGCPERAIQEPVTALLAVRSS